MFGELLATSVMARGCVGVVVTPGSVTCPSAPHGSSGLVTGVHASGTVKATPGSVNLPVAGGGATVGPGDVVVADDDGVVMPQSESAGDVRCGRQRWRGSGSQGTARRR